MPITTVIASAISGEAIDIARDGSGRASSFSIGAPAAVRDARGRSSTRRSARRSPRRSATLGETRPWAMTTSRSQISNSSSSSSLTTSTAQPASRRASSSPRICAAAPTSTPQVGCETTSSFGSASISRPTMNFCRLPPERLFAAEPGAAGLDVEAADQRLGQRRDVADADPAAGADRARARQQRVLRQREGRHGTAAEPLLGNEVQAGGAPRARRGARDVALEELDRAGRRAPVLARDRRHQLLLAVAGDAGDADHLAGANVERDLPRARCRTDPPWPA